MGALELLHEQMLSERRGREVRVGNAAPQTRGGAPGSDEIRDAGTCCCREGSAGWGVVLDRAADVGLEHPSLDPCLHISN